MGIKLHSHRYLGIKCSPSSGGLCLTIHDLQHNNETINSRIELSPDIFYIYTLYIYWITIHEYILPYLHTLTDKYITYRFIHTSIYTIHVFLWYFLYATLILLLIDWFTVHVLPAYSPHIYIYMVYTDAYTFYMCSTTSKLKSACT